MTSLNADSGLMNEEIIVFTYSMIEIQYKYTQFVVGTYFFSTLEDGALLKVIIYVNRW